MFLTKNKWILLRKRFMNRSYKRKLQLFFVDVTLYLLAYLAVALVFSNKFNIFTPYSEFYFAKGLVLGAIIFLVRGGGLVYKWLWRYANYFTYTKLIGLDAISFAIYFILAQIFAFFYLPLDILLVIVMGNMLLSLFSRFAYQILYYWINTKKDEREGQTKKINKINVVIVGAGNVGVSLAEILQRNPRAHYHPYCFVDNDKNKVGSTVCGLRVYDDDDTIVEKINKMPVQEIIIAITDIDADCKARLFNKFSQTNCKVKTYDYPTQDLVGSKGKIRELRIEDLLFRDALKFSTKETAEFYTNKTVLVTGGGGSIGSEICRQVAKQNPKKLVIVDIYENNAYEIQQELIRKYKDTLNLEVYIASVRDERRLDYLFNNIRPDIVIHAAAHKHVPLMEDSTVEAIKNNVFGTYNTANMAEKYGVKKFILISTDKAVNPTNVMGASKRLCEMVIQCRQDNPVTKFTAVRFGNVLGSNGSVIPLFKKQIENGGPITITDKRIIRYFMTIPEATQLVLECGAMAKNGELFVLDMGKPVKILDLAENMIKLSGLTPYVDIDIKEIGLRPGEKLYEELLMKNEELTKTDNKMIFIERDKPYSRVEVEEKLTLLKTAIDSDDNDVVRQAIKQTVPTYISPKLANSKLLEIEKKQFANDTEEQEIG